MLGNERHFGNDAITITADGDIVHEDGKAQVIPPGPDVLTPDILPEKTIQHPYQQNDKKGGEETLHPTKNECIGIAGYLHHKAAVQPVITQAQEKVNEHGSKSGNLVPGVEVPVALVGEEVILIQHPPIGNEHYSAIH